MNPIVVQVLNKHQFNDGRLDLPDVSDYFQWRTPGDRDQDTAYRLGRELTPGLDYLSNFLRVYTGNYRHG